MVRSGRGGHGHSDVAASYTDGKKKNFRDDIITTLHPEGSTNAVQISEEKRELERPHISFIKAVLNTIIPLLVSFCICFVSK